MYFNKFFQTDVYNFFVLLRRAETIPWNNFAPVKDPGSTKNAALPGSNFSHIIARYNLWRIHKDPSKTGQNFITTSRDHVITTLVKLIVNSLQSDIFQTASQQNAKKSYICLQQKSERKNSPGEKTINYRKLSFLHILIYYTFLKQGG